MTQQSNNKRTIKYLMSVTNVNISISTLSFASSATSVSSFINIHNYFFSSYGTTLQGGCYRTTYCTVLQYNVYLRTSRTTTEAIMFIQYDNALSTTALTHPPYWLQYFIVTSYHIITSRLSNMTHCSHFITLYSSSFHSLLIIAFTYFLSIYK